MTDTVDRLKAREIWTFQWAGVEGMKDDKNWIQSKKEFLTLQEAGNAAADWMVICAENDYKIATRLHCVKKTS